MVSIFIVHSAFVCMYTLCIPFMFNVLSSLSHRGGLSEFIRSRESLAFLGFLMKSLSRHRVLSEFMPFWITRMHFWVLR